MTIPETGTYRFIACGAGHENSMGASVRCDINLKRGKKICFAIGQQGSWECRGGCGATIVTEVEESSKSNMESHRMKNEKLNDYDMTSVSYGPMSERSMTSQAPSRITSPTRVTSPSHILSSSSNATSRSKMSSRRQPIKDQPRKPMRRKMSCESVYPDSTVSTLNLAAKSTRESTMYDSSIANLNPPKRMFFFGDPLIVAGGGGRNCGGDKRLSNASRGEKGHPSGRIKYRVDIGFGGESDREFCGGAGIKGNGHVGLTGLTPAMNFYDGFDGGWSELNKKLYFGGFGGGGVYGGGGGYTGGNGGDNSGGGGSYCVHPKARITVDWIGPGKCTLEKLHDKE